MPGRPAAEHRRTGTYLIDELASGSAPPRGPAPPSRLLDATSRVVRFTGRSDEITGLTAWRDADAAMAVRLVHAGPGEGKTRLAHRFAELSRRDRWITLRARHSRDAAVRPVETTAGEALVEARSLLVVVDHADRWPVTDLLALLLDRRLHGSPGLRVLLLARTAGNWWHWLRHELADAIGVHADALPLPTLPPSYAMAAACFAQALGVPLPDTPPPAVAEGPVLAVHMAALTHVLRADPPSVPEFLLAQERAQWISRSPALGRMVFLAALTRSLDPAAAVAVVEATGAADDAVRALDEHAACYPPPRGQATALEPLYPAPLAEDFVALHHADPWATRALETLLAEGAGTTALPLLAEAAARAPRLARIRLIPFLAAHPEAAVAAGSPALAALAAADYLPREVLAAIESAFPADAPADLHPGIAAVTERLAAEDRGRGHGLERAAGDPATGLKLGWRLLHTGRIADAVRLLTAAVLQIRRQPGNTARLELALRSLGRAQLRAQDWAGAADALGEAAGMWTAPAVRAKPPADEAAACLTDLSLALWQLGEDDAALDHSWRAVTHLRRLAAADPRHREALVRALLQHAEQLRGVKRHHDALRALEETATVLRAMPVLEDDLARTLLGRARTLQSLRQLPASARAAADAVRVLERLAGVNVAYDRDLARALAVHAAALAGLERWPEALAAQSRAVSIHRRLHRLSPRRYGLDLARGLITFARICRTAGRRRRDALTALSETMGLLQRDRHDPAVRDKLLYAARSVGADLLDADGRHAEADSLRRAARPAP
ncbi:hypothetical protein ACQP2F_27200 [Actinoplanes sp. CA-030573]|uniref:hypothetical protein n=1 Tax=Actinoplanes sp. CA-030573 TaxID=3239898 RepID=UPI003D8A5A81